MTAEQVIAWATVFQALLLLTGLLIAINQLIQSSEDSRAQIRHAGYVAAAEATDKIFDRMTSGEIYEAIICVSQHIDPIEDQKRIASDLSPTPDENKLLYLAFKHKREQCEADILLLANFFEGVYEKFEHKLIDRERYLEMQDELTLFVCHSLATAHKYYDQPDYGPLFDLGRECQANYRKRNGPCKTLLNLVIPPNPARFARRDGAINPPLEIEKSDLQRAGAP
ncbi:MAG: hypothetical protein WCE44_06675 [Candidatus Velthaea sp.]